MQVRCLGLHDLNRRLASDRSVMVEQFGKAGGGELSSESAVRQRDNVILTSPGG